MSRVPPATPDPPASEAEVLLTVLKELKAEQRSRMTYRDNLAYTTIAAIGAVILAASQLHSTLALLLLPPTSFILGWKYLSNDEKISSIGKHLRVRISPRLTELTGADYPILDWEHNRPAPLREVRRWIQRASDVTLFVLPPLTAITWVLISQPPTLWLYVASTMEALTALALLIFAISHNDSLPRSVP